MICLRFVVAVMSTVAVMACQTVAGSTAARPSSPVFSSTEPVAPASQASVINTSSDHARQKNVAAAESSETHRRIIIVAIIAAIVVAAVIIAGHGSGSSY